MNNRESQSQRWDMIENYLFAIRDCMQNAADDNDKERLLELESEKTQWLKKNFVIGRPSPRKLKVNIFDNERR